jgi:hypothetical protein
MFSRIIVFCCTCSVGFRFFRPDPRFCFLDSRVDVESRLPGAGVWQSSKIAVEKFSDPRVQKFGGSSIPGFACSTPPTRAPPSLSQQLSLCIRSASRKPRAYRLAHQTAPRRGGGQLGVVTCGVADAAAGGPPSGGLGLGRLGAVIRPMGSPWRRRLFK